MFEAFDLGILIKHDVADQLNVKMVRCVIFT